MIAWAMLALGAFSQIAQALLIRELLVVFYGNEISLGAFYGSWLWWIAVGAAGVAWAQGRGALRRPDRGFVACVLVLPLLLAGQIAAARGVRLFTDASSIELVSLGELFFSTLVLTLPTGVVIGAAFPLGCKALAQAPPDAAAAVRAISRLYVAEALGALLGGVLFTFVLVEWLGVWRTLGVSAAALAAVGGALSRRRWPAAALAAVGLAVAVTPLGGWLQAHSEAARFASLYPGLTLVDAVETRYGHVALARLREQTSVVVDGRVAESFPNPEEVARDAAYLAAQAPGARRALLLGGVPGGLAAELLRYPFEHLDVVEQDVRAFDRIRPHLPATTLAALDDPRLTLHFIDGRRFVNACPTDAGYDLVLALSADPTSAESNRYFTRDFYARVAASMAADGVLCTAVDSASNYLGRDVKSYSASVFRTLREVFPHVAVAPGDRHVLCASRAPDRVSVDAETLARRYRALPVSGRTFPAESFEALLPPERVAFVRQQLEGEPGPVNTDLRPVTYFLNLILWGKLSGSGVVELLYALQRMGPWPYVLPLLVFVALWTLRAAAEGRDRQARRRGASVYALFALGFVAMAAQLQLLLAYQAHVGFVFGRVALLNGVFMTGLALGAGAVGHRLARGGAPGAALAGLLAVVAAGCAALPTAIAAVGAGSEAGWLGLVGAAGVLTGTGFPLAAALAHGGDVGRTGGVLEAADHLGGALGGAVTGALLVPLLGVGGTADLLAAVALSALLPVALAELRRAGPAALRARGYLSFPFPRLSWTLAFATITVFLLMLVGRAAAPGPTVRFADATLAEVSGSASFQLREAPMPHYVGGGGEGPRRTASLATMPVAGEVRGYAGPINLLIAVDEAGVLRGVRYVESDETPSYLIDFDAWLAALAGRDLSQAPLSLDDVDALTGATITGRAAVESINRAARAVSEAALGRALPGPPGADTPGVADALLSPRVGLVALLLLAFFPVYLSGRDGPRLAYQVAVLAVLGVAFNALVTEVDLVNASRGRFPSPVANPAGLLLVAFAGVTAVLFGPVYCGYVCPFGALQELLSRVGRLLRLRRYADHWLDQRMRYFKYVLLAAALVAFWITGDRVWVSFNPMQHVFAAHLGGWIGLVAGVSLLGAVLYYRFWCRYFCPLGAFLALGNKLAILGHRAPTRRFPRCDLGVRDPFDVDCVQCSRCVNGVDLGVHGGRVRRNV